MTNIKRAFLALLVGSATLFSCGDKGDAPVIESIWLNMYAEPVRAIQCAYPGQVLCIHGRQLSGLQNIEINETLIDVTGTLIYDTDRYATFTVPTGVNLSEDYGKCYVKVVTLDGEYTYSPFLIKPTSLKPSISSISSTILLPGSTLTIKGQNLDGAVEVYLPLAFGGKEKCDFLDKANNTAREISVIVPSDVNFVKGRLEIIMEKSEAISSVQTVFYSEQVFSSEMNFSN